MRGQPEPVAFSALAWRAVIPSLKALLFPTLLPGLSVPTHPPLTASFSVKADIGQVNIVGRANRSAFLEKASPAHPVPLEGVGLGTDWEFHISLTQQTSSRWGSSGSQNNHRDGFLQSHILAEK